MGRSTTGGYAEAGRRLDERPAPMPGSSRRLLERGIHPASMLPLLTDATARCGQCALLLVREVGDRRFTKCANAAAENRHGPDVPPDTPACQAFASQAAYAGASSAL